MTKPLISIIVPNYNHAKFLRIRLTSIFSQTYDNFEVILLDDSSSDGSKDILLEYKNDPRVSHCIINKENSGSTFKQWNKGIALAKGEFVWIAESDDSCEVNLLEQLLRPHFIQSDLALSYCQSHRMNAKGEVTGNWITHTSEFGENLFKDDFVASGNDFIEKFLIHKNVIPNVSAVLFRKSELNKILPLFFEPYMKYNADWYYYIQLVCNSKLAFISDSLNYFRYHNNSVISRAGGESGWMKIFKMELSGRQKMLDYLAKRNLENLVQIKKQARIGNDRLHFLTARGFINSGEYYKAYNVVISKPRLIKKILKFLIKEKTLK